MKLFVIQIIDRLNQYRCPIFRHARIVSTWSLHTRNPSELLGGTVTWHK